MVEIVRFAASFGVLPGERLPLGRVWGVVGIFGVAIGKRHRDQKIPAACIRLGGGAEFREEERNQN